jgi:hypothetical protein
MHGADIRATVRLSGNNGIAIGPILFIIAILAILATAIAAGSSTFATSSGQESNRTNAASMISIGQNLKMGVDRIVALGTSLTNVDINSANTTSNTALFSPLGGGLVPPSTALASNPSSDTWIYTWGAVTNLGSTAVERIAALKVNSGVCDQINTQAGNGATPSATALGNIANATSSTDTANSFSAWPAGLAAKMLGCVNNSSGGAAGTYFYQVLGVQ